MASDAHAHPCNLAELERGCEEERVRLGIRCAASAFAPQEFLYNERIAKTGGGMALCFAIHPQLPAHSEYHETYNVEQALRFLEELARDGRIAAVGETGFDLYNNQYKTFEAEQTRLFNEHLRIARRYQLPAVLHIRRAIHKVFQYAKELSRLPAVVFHSFQGTLEEAQSILRHGINAWYSFGLPIAANHKKAIRCCAALDINRILFETDAPYQHPRDKPYTSYRDLYNVIETAARLRNTSPREIEELTDRNWERVFRVNQRFNV